MIYFKPQELVDRDTYNLLGDDSLKLFDQHILRCLDNFRHHLDQSITINDWSWGGNYSLSGYRQPSETVGAKKSRHKLGIAFDMKVDDFLAFDEFVEKHGNLFYITRMEDPAYTDGWRHIEFGFEPVDKIKVFIP